VINRLLDLATWILIVIVILAMVTLVEFIRQYAQILP
jgi:hypothetical protein